MWILLRVYFLRKEYMDCLKLLKVATRMLFDVIAVMEKKETDYQVGCKCKDVDIAKALQKMLAVALEDCPVNVLIKDEMVVIIVPTPSSPEAS